MLQDYVYISALGNFVLGAVYKKYEHGLVNYSSAVTDE